MGGNPIWHPRWLPKLENMKNLQLWLYPNNDGRRIFFLVQCGQHYGCLSWKWILYLILRSKRQLVGELSAYGAILKGTWGGKMRESLSSYCHFVHYEIKNKKKNTKKHLRYILFSVVEQWLPSIYTYTLEGTNLENVESIKYLGVTITSDLRWNTHVSNVCTKANRILGFLRRNL